MQFDNMQAFWAMGGYALYVWLSFGVTFAVMVAIVIHSVVAQKRLLAAVSAESARQRRIAAARPTASPSTQAPSR